MKLHFNGLSYVKDCYYKNHEAKPAYILHIIEVDTPFIVNEFISYRSSVAFCFIVPERTRRHMNKGRTVIYVHQSLRIAEQELTMAIKELITAKSFCSKMYSRKSELTQRQRKILYYLLKGITVDEIARKTNVTVKTVYSHRRMVYSKLGVRNMAEFYKQKQQIELLYNSDEALVEHCNRNSHLLNISS